MGLVAPILLRCCYGIATVLLRWRKGGNSVSTPSFSIMRPDTTTICGIVVGAAFAVSALPSLPKSVTAIVGIIAAAAVGTVGWHAKSWDRHGLALQAGRSLPRGSIVSIRQTRRRVSQALQEPVHRQVRDSTRIEVGTPVARRPPHRSRRAVFPHRALQVNSLSHAPAGASAATVAAADRNSAPAGKAFSDLSFPQCAVASLGNALNSGTKTANSYSDADCDG